MRRLVFISMSFGAVIGALLLTAGTDEVSKAVSDEISDATSKCAKPEPGEEILYSEDFHWNYTLQEMQARFDQLYPSGRRLKNRAFYDAAAGSYVLPMDRGTNAPVRLPKRLIQSVRRHIETALQRGYVQNVFFPDMGHTHFFIPQGHWDRTYVPIRADKTLLETLFNDPEVKILYHTAEQLRTLDEDRKPLTDRAVAWRFHTRNIVGDNRGQGILEIHQNIGSVANTMHEYPGHFYYGGGFNLSASKDGCFAYNDRGTVRYFDISLKDLEPREAPVY